MKRFLLLGFYVLAFAFVPIDVMSQHRSSTDNKIEAEANINMAKFLMDEGRLESAVEKLNAAVSLDQSNKEAQELLKQCNERLERQRIERERAEQTAFEQAKRSNTKQALESFLQDYPSGKNSSRAKLMIEDFDLWHEASSLNTIEAYNRYLRLATHKIYAEDAKVAINNIRAANEWQRLQQSTSISDYERFVYNFPDSPIKPQAEIKLHQLKAINYYNNKSLDRAYDEFKKAGGYSNIEPQYRGVYDKVVDYHNYSILDKTSDYSLLHFLCYYPNSAYYDDVSNQVARLMADKFSAYTSEDDFNKALGYARDKDTKKYVEARIRSSKTQKALLQAKSYRSQSSYYSNSYMSSSSGSSSYSSSRKHPILLEIGLLDAGLNFITSEDSRTLNLGYYNLGVGLRFGDNESTVRIDIGLKLGVELYKVLGYNGSAYGYLGREYSYDKYNDSSRTYYFHTSLSTKVNVNLFKFDFNKRFYICAFGQYNAVKNDAFENDFSVGGGIGFLGDKWDFSLYYRQDLGEAPTKVKNDVRYLGVSLSYFMKLQ